MARRIEKRLFFICILICILVISTSVLFKYRAAINKNLLKEIKSKVGIKKVVSAPIPFKVGENLVFRLDLGFLTIGRSNLTFEGKTELNGKEVYLIKFVTHAANFRDTDKIYAEIDTFLPLRVERDIKMLGKKIDIVEEYNQKENFVKITKTSAGKVTEQVIRSDQPIDNILCLIYRYRMPDAIEVGKKMSINMPLKTIGVKVKEIKEVKISKGRYEAYIIESDPKGYSFWFDSGEKKLPLSIDGAINFGNARMVLSDFN